ncbi:MAG: IS607 family transposase [Acidimicrobiales bacterium]
MDTYPPRVFGRMIGRSVSTLQRWDRDGVLKAHRSPTNRRYYTHDDYLAVIGQKPKEPRVVAYVRVSSAAQKPDLANQRAAVEQFCIAAGKAVAEYLEDVESGLNYKRKNFLRLMEQVEHGEVSEIVIAHKDRLVRFGFEFFQKFCADHGCEIVVMNAESLSPEEEMVQDLLSIVHCFSSRLYGLRRYKKSDIAAMART